MQIFDNIGALASYKDVILTIGSFDGVHGAHQKIIRRLTAIAEEVKGTSVVISFYPHPRTVIDPDFQFTVITTEDERNELLKQLGVDVLLRIPFTKEFAALSYLDFVRLLAENMDIHTIVLGYNHNFGKNREGNAELLRITAKEFNFQVVEIEKVLINSMSVSSTLIRKKMSAGKIAEVNSLLAYIYKLDVRIEKEIVKNHQFQISLLHPSKIFPAKGVFPIQIGQYNAELCINDTISITFDKLAENIKTAEIYTIYFI